MCYETEREPQPSREPNVYSVPSTQVDLQQQEPAGGEPVVYLVPSTQRDLKQHEPVGDGDLQQQELPPCDCILRDEKSIAITLTLF